MKKVLVIAVVVALAAIIIIPTIPSDAGKLRARYLGSLIKLSFASVAVDIPMVKGYYNNGEVFYIHTEASDKDTADMLTKMVNFKTVYAPLLEKAPRSALADLYVFQNGIEGDGMLGFQPNVFDSTPAETSDYSPLRLVKLVKWNEESRARELKSIEEIMDAERKGELQVTESKIVINAPMIKWPAGQMVIREGEITDDMPYVGGQVTKIDTENMKVTFIAHRGWGPDGKTIYYIVTDATPEMPANMMGVVYAPKTENLASTPAAVDLFQFANGIKGSGPMGFQPGIGAANAGDINYSPMWRISFIKWHKPLDARILETISDINNMSDKISIELAMEGKHIVNCPFITIP